MTFLRALGCALLCQASLAVHADPLSYARYDQVRTRDLQLDLKADFTQKTLSGYAELTLKWIDPAARTLVLDTRDLAIAKVQVQDPYWETADIDTSNNAWPRKITRSRLELFKQDRDKDNLMKDFNTPLKEADKGAAKAIEVKQ